MTVAILVTHAVCVGMTGSGKSGLGISMLEEATIDGIPSIVIDPKGDLSDLLLTFPQLRPEDFFHGSILMNCPAKASRLKHLQRRFRKSI